LLFAAMLLDGKLHVRSRTTAGWSMLHVAAHKGRDAAVRLLVQAGISINAVDDSGRPVSHLMIKPSDVEPLHREVFAEPASRVKNWAMLGDLLDEDAAVKERDRKGWTAHQYVACKDQSVPWVFYCPPWCCHQDEM